VQLQPYVLQLIDRMETWFQSISGRTDVTQGVNPPGVTAMGAIAALQESAQTRMRQKSRNLDASLQSCGQLYKNRVFQYRTAPEIIRLTNQQGATKYFKFYVEPTQQPDGTTARKAVVRPFNQDPASGQYTEALEAKEYMIKGDFDVKVSTGSSLPFAKTEKANLAFKLHEAQAIDRRELLKAVDYPNWEAVADRMDQLEQQAAQAEAQAAEAEAMAKNAPPQPQGALPPQ
jgi:hypothetical protein